MYLVLKKFRFEFRKPFFSDPPGYLNRKNLQRGFIKLTKRTLISYMILFLIFSGTGFIFLFNPFGTKSAEAAWFNDNWSYRQSIALTYSSTALTDFQVSFTLNTSSLIAAGKLQSDCDDLRVTTVDGTIIPVWIDGSTSQSTGCNQTGTVVWTKIPAISSDMTLYVYYGNPTAITTEDGEKVFTFYDDFESASVNSTDWGNNITCGTTTQQATATQEYKGSYGAESYQSTDCGDSLISHSFGATGQRVVEVRFYDDSSITTAGRNMLAQLGASIGDFSAGVNTDTSTTHYVYRNGGSYTTTSIARSTGWHKIRWIQTATTVATYFDGTEIGSATATNYAAATAVTFGSFITAPAGFYYDSPFARKYAATEPTIGAPASEEKSLSPIGYWKFDDGQGTTVQDYSPNNNDLTLTGTVPTWMTEDKCISAKCLYYLGTPSGSGSTVATSTLTPYSQLTSGTISFWAKITEPNAQQSLFFLGRTSDTNNSSLQIYYDNRTSGGSNFQVTLRQDSTIYWDFTVAASQFNTITETNRWHYYTLVHDGTVPSLYVDGNSMNLSFSTSTDQTKWLKAIITDATNDANAIRVMQAYVNSTTFFPAKGFIDELKLYPQNRTAAQIKADYTARSNPDGVAAQLGNSASNKPGTLSDGLVGHWKQDESSWTVDCSTESVLDWAGNSNHGESCPNTTGPAGGSPGKFGFAGSFDGSNDYINIDDAVTLTPGSNSWTVSVWANPANASQTSPLITKRLDGAPSYEQWSIYICGADDCSSGGQQMTGIYQDHATGNYYRYTTTADVADGNWHMYTMVADKNNLQLLLYVDGILQTTTGEDSDTWPTIDNTDPVRLANDNGTTYYTGKLDEARAYNRALSDIEVRQLYSWTPGPTGYWKMDNGSTTVVYDDSGNGNNADIAGSGGEYQNGKLGKAFSFDGLSTHLYAASPASLDNLPAISISAWIYPVTIGENTAGFIMTKNTGNSQNGGWLFLGVGSIIGRTNALEFVVDATGTDLDKGTVDNTLTLNTWNHVAVTWDGVITTASSVHIYVNGVEATYQTSTNGTGTRVSDATSSLYLGNASSVDRTFNGRIDDAKVYNYVRTQAQITEDMNGGHPAPGSPVGSAVGHWKFDEGYGTTANNYGNGGTTLTGAITAASPATADSGWSNSGKFNKALSFDGSDDVAVVTNAAAIDLDGNLATHTFSSWVYADSDGENDTGEIYAKGTNTYLRVDSEGAGLVDLECNLDQTTDTNVNVTDAFAISTWNHVACTWDGTTMKVYVNGLEKGSSAAGSGAIATDANNIRIGGTNAFDGKIDEFKIYNSALSAEQIKGEMNRGSSQVLGALSVASDTQPNSAANEYCPPDSSAAICTGPVAEWKFEEGSGSTANDSTGNANTGTFTGAAFENGRNGKSAGFVGSGSSTSSFGSATSLDDLPTGDFTMEKWLYLEERDDIGGNSSMVLIGKVNDPGGCATPNGWDLASHNSSLNLNFGAEFNTTDARYTSANNVLQKNVWQHVSLVWNGTAKSAKLYVNGKEVSYTTQTAGSGTYGSDASGNLRLSSHACSSLPFKGKTDDLRIFNYARSQPQIAWDYNKGGPIAWYKMDECQGSTIRDSSGNNLSGTLTVGAGGGENTVGTCQTSSTAWGNGATGKRNYSIDLDGTDDSITVADNSALDLTTTGTLAAWVYRDSTGSWHGVIHKGSDNTCNNGYCLDIQDDNRVLAVVGNGSNETLLNSLATISSGQWYHLAFTWDGTDTKIYINGRLDNETSQTYSASANANSLHIGELGTSDYFNGQIDDARVYNYGLTETQVKTLYNDGAVKFGPVSGSP